MKALSPREFLKTENLENGCLSCGGKLKESERKNTTPEGVELPRFYCVQCGEIYEQTDDYGVE